MVSAKNSVVSYYLNKNNNNTLKSSIAALEKVQATFVKRVAWRCGLAGSSIPSLPTLQSRRVNKDIKMLRNIADGRKHCEPILISVRTASRNGISINARDLPRSCIDTVSQQFARRTSRLFRESRFRTLDSLSSDINPHDAQHYMCIAICRLFI